MSNLLFDDDGSGFDLAVEFALQLELTAVPLAASSARSDLVVNVSLLPPVTAGRSQHLRFRLSADGVEVPVKAFSMDEPVESSGQQLDLTLVRVSDRAAVKAASSFLFEVSIVDLVTGSDTWTPLFEDGVLASSSLSISWGSGAAADQLSISTLSPLANRLSKAPLTDLTIFDPLRVEVKASDDVLYDTNGTAYPEELMEKPDLNLYDLLRMVLVDRCGFSGVQTNLPKYPIRLAKASMESSMYDQMVKPHIGQFKPLQFEKDGVIWLLDSTQSFPAGFPAPRELHISRYKQLSINERYQDIDGYKISFSETDAAPLSYFVTRTETDEVESGQVFDATYSITTTVRTFKDYKRSPVSTVITRSELWKEVKTKRDSLGVILGETSLERFFDQFGREKQTIKKVSNRVPDVPVSTDLVLKEVSQDAYDVTYAPHPYHRGQSFIQQTVTSTTGLIAIDSAEQYLGADFEQDFMQAHRSGSIKEDFTTRSGAIRKVTQRIRPLPDGTVQTETETEDLIKGVTSQSESETRAGDVGIQTLTTRQRQLIVLRSDAAVKTGKPTPAKPVGELPLELAVPLVRRQLAQEDLGGGDLAVSFDGLDLSIRRGSVLNIIGRDGSLGVMLVEGGKRQGDALGSRDQKVSTSLQGMIIGYVDAPAPEDQAPVDPTAGGIYDLAGNPISSASFDITSEGVILLQIQIDCVAGKRIRATATADLVISAKESTQADGSYIQIEGDPFYLDPWDGERRTFTIKLEAAAVSSIEERAFTISVR